MTDEEVTTGQVVKEGKQFRTITEGKATILVPEEGKGKVQQVFYNPIQQFNRDLSVLAIKTYGEEVDQRRRAQFESRAQKQGTKRKRRVGDEGEKEANGSEQTSKHNVSEDPPEATAEPDAPPREYKSTFKILDALSASGLRALRYAHELPFVSAVTANDLSPSAADTIKANVAHNGLEDKVQVNNDDALALMYRAIADDLSNKDRHGNPGRAHKFDVIDLDPYGTAAPFFDAAVQAIRDDGGLLCITCTDSSVWAGHSYSEKCYALYGGVPVHGGHSHEVGLRLILHGVATSAARYGLHIEPLLSLSIDFYTKFFIKVTKSQQAVKFLSAKTMLAYTCDQGCGTYTVQHLMRSKPQANKKGDGQFYKHILSQGPTADQNCQFCGFKRHLTGPMYGGLLHSQDFIQRLLDQASKADPSTYATLPRLQGMLRTALEEHIPGPEPPETVNPKDAEAARIDHYPFYFIPSRLAGALHSVSMPDDLIRGALIHLGYQVSRSHCRPGSIKTNAPWSTIWFVLTEWIRQKSSVTEANIKPATAAFKILTDARIIGPNKAGPFQQDEAKSFDIEMTGDSQIQEPAATPSADASRPAKENDAAQPRNEEELRKTLVFDDALARLGRQTAGKRIVRYQTNPEKNWGPLTRASAQ